MILTIERVKGGLFGLCIGDALGLPVEGIAGKDDIEALAENVYRSASGG